MKSKKEKVRSDGQVIGVVDVPVFDSIAEMASNVEGGEARVLALAQTQHGTNLKNNVRAEFAGKPPKGRLREEALADLARGSDLNRIREVLTDPTKREAYLEEAVKKVEAEWEARRKARIAEVAKAIASDPALAEAADEEEASAAA